MINVVEHTFIIYSSFANSYIQKQFFKFHPKLSRKIQQVMIQVQKDPLYYSEVMQDQKYAILVGQWRFENQ